MSRFLTREEAAAHLSARGLKITETTLQKLATSGGGPRYAIFGNRALYRPADLDAWAEGRLKLRGSTSEAA
jgi:hypothetical protein